MLLTTLIITTLSTIVYSCNKVKPTTPFIPVGDTTEYLLNDSNFTIINEGKVISEDHTPFSKKISITKDNGNNTLYYAGNFYDSFSAKSYSLRNGSFPIISIGDSTISISYHIGGSGYQQWLYIRGVKL